ncbi:MAG: Gfo/Idh/MocA family oxidoreductase [Pseudomonadota bacterium]
MTTDRRMPRLRFFEQSPGQQHIVGDDKYLYAQGARTHTINVIGTGTIGQEHMRVCQLAGRARVGGVFDSQSQSVDVALRNFSEISQDKPTVFDTLEAACNDPDATALFICTPNHTHLEVLRTAMASGKPIFVEKPMATTLSDALAMVELVERYESFVQIGLQYRYKAPYVEARHEALNRGVLGDIKTISMAEYRPAFLDKVNQWNKFSRHSGGTLVEKCCHYFDLMNLFAGARAKRVFASAGQAVNFVDFEYDGERSDIDDHAFVIVEYENGIRANFTLNMFCPKFREELVLVGTDGKLTAIEQFDFLSTASAESHVAIEHPEPAASRQIAVGYPAVVEGSGHHGATWFEHLAFYDQLEGKTVDCATAVEGLWSVLVATAAQQSAASGMPVEIAELLNEHQIDHSFIKESA